MKKYQNGGSFLDALMQVAAKAIRQNRQAQINEYQLGGQGETDASVSGARDCGKDCHGNSKDALNSYNKAERKEMKALDKEVERENREEQKRRQQESDMFMDMHRNYFGDKLDRDAYRTRQNEYNQFIQANPNFNTYTGQMEPEQRYALMNNMLQYIQAAPQISYAQRLGKKFNIQDFKKLTMADMMNYVNQMGGYDKFREWHASGGPEIRRYGGLTHYQRGGVRPPIYTNDPRKVKAYDDSVTVNNYILKYNKLLDNPNATFSQIKNFVENRPDIVRNIVRNRRINININPNKKEGRGFGFDGFLRAIPLNPVQPYIYRPNYGREKLVVRYIPEQIEPQKINVNIPQGRMRNMTSVPSVNVPPVQNLPYRVEYWDKDEQGMTHRNFIDRAAGDEFTEELRARPYGTPYGVTGYYEHPQYQGGGNVWQGTRDVYTTDRMLPQSSLDSMNLYQDYRYIPMRGYQPTILRPSVQEDKEMIQELHRQNPEILKRKIKPVGYYKAKVKSQKKDKTGNIKVSDYGDVAAPMYMKPKLHYVYTPPFTPSSSDYSVYGPGNSLIGFVNSKGEFHPAMDQYARGMNAPDVQMLNDENALIKYLKNKGIYNPAIKR